MNISRHIRCSIAHETQIFNICKELINNSKITYFGYNRFYPDNKFMGLYTNYRYVENSLKNCPFPPYVDERGLILASGNYFFKDVKNYLYTYYPQDHVNSFSEQANCLASKRNLDAGFFIVRKNISYDEMFFFSSSLNQEECYSYYMNLLEELKNFISYFLYQARKIIEEAKTNITSYCLPERKPTLTPFLHQLKCTKELLSGSFATKKYNLVAKHGDSFVSKQELKVLRQLSLGLTHKEIAGILNLAPKTVEAYLENIKFKLHINNKNEMVAIYKDYSPLEVNRS